jgi:hypothetical protein
VTTIFRAKSLGPAKISLEESSIVLLSDGLGTPLKLAYQQVSFPIVPENAASALIKSPSHPDPNAWSKVKTVEVEVEQKPGESYSYTFSANADIFPDNVPDDVSQKLVFSDLPDGVYYFKLNSRLGQGNWEEAGVRAFRIDTTPPELFTPVVAADPAVLDGKPFVSFAANDQVSGLQKYEVKVGVLGTWVEVDKSYFVLTGASVPSDIQVKAVDAAGNEQIVKAEFHESLQPTNFNKWLIFAIITGSIIGLGYWLKRSYSKQKQQ